MKSLVRESAQNLYRIWITALNSLILHLSEFIQVTFLINDS